MTITIAPATASVSVMGKSSESASALRCSASAWLSVQGVELLELAFLRVRRAHDANARERLAKHAGHAVIEVGQLDTDALQPAIDKRQRAAERDRQQDDE